jgi:hypothetical protein
VSRRLLVQPTRSPSGTGRAQFQHRPIDRRSHQTSTSTGQIKRGSPSTAETANNDEPSLTGSYGVCDLSSLGVAARIDGIKNSPAVTMHTATNATTIQLARMNTNCAAPVDGAKFMRPLPAQPPSNKARVHSTIRRMVQAYRPVVARPDGRLRRAPIDAPMCCQGASDVAGRPVMGHSGEGRLLLGRAVSGREGWAGGRRIDRRTTGDGVRQFVGQATNPELCQPRGSSW